MISIYLVMCVFSPLCCLHQQILIAKNSFSTCLILCTFQGDLAFYFPMFFQLLFPEHYTNPSTPITVAAPRNMANYLTQNVWRLDFGLGNLGRIGSWGKCWYPWDGGPLIINTILYTLYHVGIYPGPYPLLKGSLGS